MRKLFLILPMATALLLGTNANAATKTVGTAESGATYQTLEDAVKVAASGDSIIFLSDITTTVGALIQNKSLVIDLKGFTYTYNPGGEDGTQPDTRTASRNIKVEGSTSLVKVMNGTVTAEGGTGDNYGIKDIGYSCGKGAIGTFRSAKGAGLILENLTLYNYHPWGLSIKMEYSKNTPQLEVNNCKIISSIGGGIEACGATVNINNCQFEQKGKNLSYGYIASCINVSVLGTINISNSSFKSSGENSLYVYNSGGHMLVTNGLFEGDASVIHIDSAYVSEVKKNLSLSTNQAAIDAINAFGSLPGWTNASEIKILDGRFTGKIVKNNVTSGFQVSGGTFDVQGDTKSQNLLDKAIVTGNEKVTNPDGTVSIIDSSKKVEPTSEIPEGAEDKTVIVKSSKNIVIKKGEVKEVKQLNIDENASVTVDDGGVLKVNGQTGIVLGNNSNSKIVVKAGAKVMVDNGLAWSKNFNSILIENNDSLSGEFLISPNVQMYGDQHPAATVTMVATMGNNGGTYKWYRFGVPMYELSTLYTNEKVQTAVYGWDAADSKWKAVASYKDLKPFEGYEITNNGVCGQYTYNFAGTLFGNATDTATFVGETGQWASFANSYTGRASTRIILADALKNGELNSIKLWNTAKGDWEQGIVLKDLEDGEYDDQEFVYVAPLRPIVFQTTGETASMIINYKEAIWDIANADPTPFVAARHNSEDAKLWLSFNTADAQEASVKFRQNTSYTDEFNNQVDNTYMPTTSSFSAYAIAKDQHLAAAGLSSLDKVVVELKSTTNTSVAINCTKLEGGEYAVKVGDTSYDLSVKDSIVVLNLTANEAVQVSLVDKGAPTMYENIDAEKVAVKGVYNLVGQYMGESLNAVPAGLYIVNGKKVVK